MSWLLLAVLLACVAGAVWWVREGRTGPGTEIFGFRSFLISSASMAPDFEVNGVAVTRDAPLSQVRVGDVVAFRAAGLGGAPALHRVIGVEPGQLTVKGDNNPHPDGAPVTPANYLGRVVFGSNLTAFAWDQEHGPYGVVRIVIIPLAALVLIWVAIRYWVDSRRRTLSRALSGTVIAFLLLASLTAAYGLYLNRQQHYIITTLARYASRFDQGPATESVRVERTPVEGTIDIPRLGLHYPIVEYVAATSLTIAVTRFAGPGLNHAGNVVLAGHRSWGNLFFARISRLRPGDLIRVTDAGRQSVTYTVTGHRDIGPDDTSALNQPGGGQRDLTLIEAGYDMLRGYAVTARAAGARAPAPGAVTVPGPLSMLPGGALPAAVGLVSAAAAAIAAWSVTRGVQRRRRRT
ncbi:MAG: signal peptidase I [Streptosporangiales bacterium]|nr:signal peptidase I [Streptosporangiales bacterium]